MALLDSPKLIIKNCLTFLVKNNSFNVSLSLIFAPIDSIVLQLPFLINHQPETSKNICLVLKPRCGPVRSFFYGRANQARAENLTGLMAFHYMTSALRSARGMCLIEMT